MKTKLLFIFLLILNIGFSQADIEYTFSADVQNVSQEGNVINYSFHIIPFGSESYSQISFSNSYGLPNLQYVGGDTNSNSIIETNEDWEFLATYTLTQNDIDTNGIPNNSGIISYDMIFTLDTTTGQSYTYNVLETVAINASTYLADDVFCADEVNNSVSLDLSYKDSLVLNGNNPNDYTITYYQNYNDAFNAVNILPNPYIAFDTPRVYARRESNVDATFEIFSFVIYINEFVSISTPTALENCQDNFIFDLNLKNFEIIGNQVNLQITYHASLTDAENFVNVLPTLYTSNTPQQLFVRVANIITSCYNTTTLMLDFIDCNESYTVNPLAFQIYSQPLENTFNLDDFYTDLIPLNFDFNYFGIDYSQVVVGTNSVISFNQTDAQSFCEWNIDPSNLLPNANIIKNAILGAYQDYNNSNGLGAQVYGFIGIAPFRKFVVLFDEVSLYSCESIKSTNQMVLYETYNFIDVQVKDRNVCDSWNQGLAILGIQNIDGSEAYFPPNRNTGDWETHNEAWRFRPQQDYPDFQYIICDPEVDGVEVFDLESIISEFDASAGSVFNFFETLADAEAFTNSIPLNYTNTSNTQTIFLRIDDNISGLSIKQILLATIDCTADYDLDNVPTTDEDLNTNGNLGDDDTDGDNIPDFLDEDDDGDYVLTNVEAINTRSSNAAYQDTDGDQIPDYLDNDDDGDGILTLAEDSNGNYILTDDDDDNDGIPNYLDNEALSVGSVTNLFSIYPNPVNNLLTIKLEELSNNITFTIYNLQGKLVYKKQEILNQQTEINITNFSSGVYFIKLESDNNTAIKKFVKK